MKSSTAAFVFTANFALFCLFLGILVNQVVCEGSPDDYEYGLSADRDSSHVSNYDEEDDGYATKPSREDRLTSRHDHSAESDSRTDSEDTPKSETDYYSERSSEPELTPDTSVSDDETDEGYATPVSAEDPLQSSSARSSQQRLASDSSSFSDYQTNNAQRVEQRQDYDEWLDEQKDLRDSQEGSRDSRPRDRDLDGDQRLGDIHARILDAFPGSKAKFRIISDSKSLSDDRPNVFIYLPSPVRSQKDRPRHKISNSDAPKVPLSRTVPRSPSKSARDDRKQNIPRNYPFNVFSPPRNMEYFSKPAQDNIRRGYIETTPLKTPILVASPPRAVVSFIQAVPQKQLIATYPVAPKRVVVAASPPLPESAYFAPQQVQTLLAPDPEPQVTFIATQPAGHTVLAPIPQQQQPQTFQIHSLPSQSPNLSTGQHASQPIYLKATVVQSPRPVAQDVACVTPLKPTFIQAATPPLQQTSYGASRSPAKSFITVRQAPYLEAQTQRMATYYVPPMPQSTRTVYTQTQFMPSHTTVHTTTQFTPATKTTVYETDHLAQKSVPVSRHPVSFPVPSSGSFYKQHEYQPQLPLPLALPLQQPSYSYSQLMPTNNNMYKLFKSKLIRREAAAKDTRQPNADKPSAVSNYK